MKKEYCTPAYSLYAFEAKDMITVSGDQPSKTLTPLTSGSGDNWDW